MITRARSIFVVFLVLVATTALVSPASAGRPKCFGKRATKVGTIGNDVINGTKRADVIVAKGGDDIINGKGGNDLICAGDGNDVIFGGPGADKINAGPGDDETTPGTGNDSITNGFGFDTLLYNDAPGPVTVDLQTGATLGASGNDKIQVVGRAPDGTPVTDVEYVVGSAFDDRLSGDNGDDHLEGGPGNDTIDGRLGFDYVRFDFASQPVTVDLPVLRATGDGVDKIVNTEGVVGSQFDDTIVGDGDVNHLFGNAGNDNINGNGGDDFIEGADGNDRLDGGGGTDSATYINAPGPVQVNLDTQTATGAAGNDTLISLERIDGSQASDQMIGSNNARDIFFGNDGADSMNGQGGNDIFDGGPGNDTITGGADTLNNNPGVGDMVRYDFSPGGVNVNLATGSALTPDGTDNFTGIEFVIGSTFDDTLTGSARSNEGFLGLEGNDVIDGGGGELDLLDFEFSLNSVTVDLTAGTATGLTEGSDTVTGIEWVIGSIFDDTINGSANSDRLDGWFGNDTMRGHDGNDRMDGGPGNDDMSGDAGFDTGDGGLGTDICRTFENLLNCESQGFRRHPGGRNAGPTELPAPPPPVMFRIDN